MDCKDTPPETSGPVAKGDAAPLEDDVLRSLDPRYVTLERIAGWIVCGVIGVGLIVGAAVLWAGVEMPAWVSVMIGVTLLVVCAGLVWVAQCFPAIEYRYKSYRVNDRRIEIRKGVLWRRVLDVPRSRVQHTDVEQGPIERKFGLAHLVIHTAGTVNASVTLEGLRYETAIAVRDLLVSTGRNDAV